MSLIAYIDAQHGKHSFFWQHDFPMQGLFWYQHYADAATIQALMHSACVRHLVLGMSIYPQGYDKA